MYWGDTAALGTISLALLPNELPSEDIEKAREAVISASNWYLTAVEQEGYRLPISRLEWGSSSAVLNNMIVMGLAYEFTGEKKYLDGMAESMDYLMGRNPLGKSYISGYGEDPLQHPHHRFWANDPANGWPAVPPGVVAGGPNETADDPTAVNAGVLASAPARRYVDDIGSWSTNEVTINWNAPLAWTAAFLDEKYNDLAQESAALEQKETSENNTQDTAEKEQPVEGASSVPWFWAALLIGALTAGVVIVFAVVRNR